VHSGCRILLILGTLEQGFELMSVGQLEVIAVSLGLQEVGAQAIDYAG